MKYLRNVIITIFLAIVCIDAGAQNIEKWGLFELTLKGSKIENPVTDNDLTALFIQNVDTISIRGFYDGDGIYKVRFMPEKTGIWRYSVFSNQKSLHRKGAFACIDPSIFNHGPVQVKDTFNFEYADGTPYHPMGTTIYGWLVPNPEVQKQTLESLKNSPFNKGRFMILVTNVNGSDPEVRPFQIKGDTINYSVLNPNYFRAIDSGIVRLQRIGIEADLIFLHPYDQDKQPLEPMTMKEIYQYLDYIIARFASYRNIWWATNEFDLLKSRSMADWDSIFIYLQKNDPYHHLRSNHNSYVWYDHTKPWITHASVQTENWWMSQPLRLKYKKPVIFDEICYEGDGDNRTVALDGNVMTHRFWMITVNGGFATHGEGYLNQETNSKFFVQGGKILGISPRQLLTLREVIDSAPGILKPMGFDWRLNNILFGVENQYYVYYLGEYQNKLWEFSELPEGMEFEAEIIDTRSGEKKAVPGTIKKNDKIELPGKPWLAMVLKLKVRQ